MADNNQYEAKPIGFVAPVSSSYGSPEQPALGGVPSPGNFPAPPVMATTERNWMAVVSLAMALVVPGLLGLGFGIAALSAAKEGRATNRTMAIWGIVLNCTMWLMYLPMWFAFNSAFSGSALSEGTVDLFSAKAGQCVAYPGTPSADESEAIETLKILDCSKPHWGQVYYVTRSAATSFPGVDALLDEADAACFTEAALQDVSASAPEDLQGTYFVPTSASWAAGERKFICIGYIAGDELSASVVTP